VSEVPNVPVDVIEQGQLVAAGDQARGGFSYINAMVTIAAAIGPMMLADKAADARAAKAKAEAQRLAALAEADRRRRVRAANTLREQQQWQKDHKPT